MDAASPNIDQDLHNQFQKLSHDVANLSQSINNLSQDFANCVVLQETVMNNITVQEEHFQKKSDETNEEFKEQLDEIRKVINEFQKRTDPLSIARFTAAAEEALRQGDEHLHKLTKAVDDFSHLTKQESMNVLEMSRIAQDRISRVVRSLRLKYFQRLVDDGCERVDNISVAAIGRVSQVVKWFHWERLGIAFVVALVMGIVMGLFLNDEWPWETHQRVVTERDAGRMLLNAWPHLSKVEQDDIRRNANVS